MTTAAVPPAEAERGRRTDAADRSSLSPAARTGDGGPGLPRRRGRPLSVAGRVWPSGPGHRAPAARADGGSGDRGCHDSDGERRGGDGANDGGGRSGNGGERDRERDGDGGGSEGDRSEARANDGGGGDGGEGDGGGGCGGGDDSGGNDSGGNGSGGNGSEGNGGDGGGDDGGGGGGPRDEPSTAEKVVTAVSVAFTLLLFGYAVWQAVGAPTGSTPSASVVGVEDGEGGNRRVTVRLTNPQDVGLVSATVTVDCGQPPPEVTFEMVPADGRETGTVVCPGGSGTPNVTVASWIET